MQETLMCLFMVAWEFCPRLGGEGISSAIEGTFLSVTDLPCHLVTSHQPVLAFSFCRNAVPLSWTVRVKFINLKYCRSPRSEALHMSECPLQLVGIFLLLFSTRVLLLASSLQKPQPPGKHKHMQPDCSYGCYPFRNLFVLPFITQIPIYAGRVKFLEHEKLRGYCK